MSADVCRISRATCLLPLLFLFSGPALRSQTVLPDCGGLNQRTCHPFDSEFYANGSGACDRGLKIDTRDFWNIKDDRCVMDRRERLNKQYNWVAWALNQQRLNIAGNEPVNWISHLTAHNAFNNEADRYAVPNQYYSITDQLNMGIRAINLDVHWYATQARVCHGTNSSFGCIATDRLYAYAIREISDWVKQNKDEIVIVIFENRAEAHSSELTRPIASYLGSRVWRESDSVAKNISHRLPTPNEMKAWGRQVIFVSENPVSGGYVHTIASNSYASSKALNFTPATCLSDGKDINGVNVDSLKYWPQLYEGRSEFENHTDIFNEMYETEVKNAVACNVTNISLDFLLSLDKAGLQHRRSGPDLRREAAVWSWKEGDMGAGGNYALFEGQSGRWVSRKEDHTAAFACAPARDLTSDGSTPLDPSKWTDPRGNEWYVTTATGNFNAGMSHCRALGLTMKKHLVFARPVNGYQAKKLAAVVGTYRNVWVNSTIRPVPQPAVTPWSNEFLVGEKQIPTVTSNKVTIWGVPGRPYAVKLIHDPLVAQWLRVDHVTGVIGDFGSPLMLQLDTTAVRTLKKGNYTTTLEVTLTETGQTNRIPVFLRVLVPTTTSLSLTNAAAVAAGQPAQFRARVTYPVGYGYLVTGTVELRRLEHSQEAKNTVAVLVGKGNVNTLADGDTNPQDTVLITASLPPGVHDVAAYYRGDADYAPSLSASVKVDQSVQATMSVTRDYAVTAPGTPVKLTAALSGTQGTPTGTVVFSTGTTALGIVSLSAGKAILSTSVLPAGSHTIKVAYSGDATYGAITQTVAHTVAAPIAYTVQTKPEGLPITIDGKTYIGKFTFSWVPGLEHTVGVASEIDRNDGNRYVDPKWSDGGALQHTIKPLAAGTLTVTYTHYVKLTMQVSSGTHTGALTYQSPTGTSLIIAGQTVKVFPQSKPGFTFASWSGAATGSTSPLSLLMNTPKTISATFEPIIAVTIGTEFAGIPFKVDGVQYTAPRTFNWARNSQHTLTATAAWQPEPSTRYEFEGWSGLAAGATHTITVGSTPVTHTAQYKRKFRLSTIVNPAGTGTVTATPAPVNGLIPEGTTVSLKATPATGYRFVRYSGSIVGTSATATFVMNQSKAITADFAR